MRPPLIALVLALLGALVVLPASPASAANSEFRASGVVTVFAGASERIMVRCPRKQRFVSGGFSTADAAALDGVAITDATWNGKRAWSVKARRLETGTAPRRVTAVVLCSRSAPKLRVATETVGAPRGEGESTNKAVSICRGDDMVRSGGFAQPGLGSDLEGGGVVLDNIESNSYRGWRVRTRAAGPAGRVRAEAYCAPRTHPVTAGGSSLFRDRAGSTISAGTYYCRRRGESGGWTIDTSGSKTFRPFVYSSVPSGGGWRTSAADLQGGEGLLDTFAYCKRSGSADKISAR